MIKIFNNKLLKLLVDKNALVKEGRKISSMLETIEFKIKKFQDKEKIITGKYEPKDLMTRGEIIRLELERVMKKFEEISTELKEAKLAQIPAKMKADHEALMAERVKLETERNKIALKIQKIKDRAVPIIKAEVKPHLKEYDDIETAEVVDDHIEVVTFNHVEQFKQKFRK